MPFADFLLDFLLHSCNIVYYVSDQIYDTFLIKMVYQIPFAQDFSSKRRWSLNTQCSAFSQLGRNWFWTLSWTSSCAALDPFWLVTRLGTNTSILNRALTVLRIVSYTAGFCSQTWNLIRCRAFIWLCKLVLCWVSWIWFQDIAKMNRFYFCWSFGIWQTSWWSDKLSLARRY